MHLNIFKGLSLCYTYKEKIMLLLLLADKQVYQASQCLHLYTNVFVHYSKISTDFTTVTLLRAQLTNHFFHARVALL